MKVYHKFKLKCGTQVVLARSQFDSILGHQVVPKGSPWNTVRMTLSKDGEHAISDIVDRKRLVTMIRMSFKKCYTKLKAIS